MLHLRCLEGRVAFPESVMNGSLMQRWLARLSQRRSDSVLQTAKSFMQDGDAAYVQGNLPSAESSYRQAVATASKFALAHQGLGAALYAQGRLDDAIAALKRAVEIDGKLVGAHELLAASYLAQTDKIQAERHLRIAITHHAGESAFLDLGAILVSQRRYDEAFQVITQGIAGCPQSAALRFFLGNLHFTTGQFEHAAVEFRESLKLKPQQRLVLYNLGLVSQKTNDFEAARDAFRRAIEFDLSWAEAHNNLGHAWYRLGNLSEAKACFERALACDPALAPAHFNLGDMAMAQGHTASALSCYKKAIEIDPDMADAHWRLGVGLIGLGRGEEAVEHLRHAVEIARDNGEALMQLAELHFSLADFENALSRFRELVVLDPDHVDALLGVAKTLFKLAESDNVAFRMAMFEEAIVVLRGLIARSPHHQLALLNLGTALGECGEIEQADTLFRKVLSLDPDCVAAHHNLGVSMESSGRRGSASDRLACYEKALEHYSAAIAIEPRHIDALMGMASIYGELLRVEEAKSRYEEILRIDPDYAPGRLSYGILKLQTGDFATGWRDFEYRWRLGTTSLRMPSEKPQWRNDANLNGKTIILYHEQGLGDSLQFVRYAKPVAELGAIVLARVPASLTRLFASCPGIHGVIADSDEIPAHDYHCPFVSLADAFSTTLDTIPADVPYLRAATDRIAHWREKFAGELNLRVGLVWAGDARKHLQGTFLIDGMRSLHFDQLRPLLNVPNVAFYSLQVGSEAAVQLTNAPKVTDVAGDLFDFQETAALAENLDLVICVDTSSAHLVGAIGKPVWLLNRFNTCWRWMLDRIDSPWYPTMRIFRQPRLGDWDSVIAEVKSALAKEAEAHANRDRSKAP